jgi:3-oxoadipate enol-lactonase
MKIQQKQVLVAGNTVSYVDEGTSSATPLLFIHGFPFDKWMWEKQVDSLKEEYRVIAYDVRGHGLSGAGTDSFTIPLFAEDLFRFMDALHIEKAFVCGLSMGGYIALQAMQQQPERIAALMLCNTQCQADSDETKKKRMDAIASIQEKGLEEYARSSVAKLFSKVSLTARTKDCAFIENTILHTHIETICNTLMALAARKETCSSLHQIHVPVLIIAGEEDQVIALESVKQMHEHTPSSTLHIMDSVGHLSNIENPVGFNQYLSRFLKSSTHSVKYHQ